MNKHFEIKNPYIPGMWLILDAPDEQSAKVKASAQHGSNSETYEAKEICYSWQDFLTHKDELSMFELLNSELREEFFRKQKTKGQTDG